MSPVADGAPAQRSFNRPISLGGGCPMAANIERHYGQAFKSPFDWWLTPFSGLVKLLSDNDPDLVFDPQALCVAPLWGGTDVFNMRYRIHFSHHFEKDENRRVLAGWQGDELTRFRLITRRLWEYFLELDDPDNGLLFFRLAHEDDLRPVSGTCIGDLVRLWAVLRRLFTRATFRIALVDYPELAATAADLPDAIAADFVFLSVRHSSQPDWKGPPDDWTREMAGIPFRYDFSSI